jgi:hypothetical protein
MAIRFDNATERLSRTTNVISFDANYTVMAWVYVVTHNGAGNGACVVSIDDQTDDVDEFYLNGATATNLTLGIVTLQGGSAGGDVGSATFTAGTWQHVCIVRSANNLRTGYRNGVSEVTHNLNRSGRTAPTAISIGSVLDSDLLNGRIACIKIWTEALTVAEIQQEIGVIHPVRMANLNRWTPGFTHTDIADYSGNGYGWTAVGTLATEDGPPVSWGAAPWVVPFAATAGAQTISPDAIASTSTVYSPTVTASAATIAPSAIASTAAVYSPTVTPGAVTISPAAIASTSTVYAPTIANGAVTLYPAAIASAATVYAPTITPGAVTLAPSAISSAATVYAPDLLANATIGGVLTQDATNGRYLANDGGPLVLAGFHTWYDLQDGGTTNPPAAFGWSTFKSALIAKGVNFTKLWRLEASRHWPSDNTQYFGLQPWTRTGPGNAADGALKFDLTSYNAEYFARLRARCIELGNAGIYVAIQLFQGFHVDNTKEGAPTGDPWDYNPFNSANNVNSINGDIDGDGIGDDSRSTSNTACYNAQKAFVEHVVDAVNDLDNVLYEISNEDGTWSEAWQKALVDYIHTYEAGKAKQHPVGMTKIYPSGTNSMLTSSNAEWISPDEDLTPAAQNDTDRVWMYDTDHAVGITSTRAWAWIALTMGYGGAWFMDLWDSGAGGESDKTADATYEQIRRTLGWVLDYAARLDLANATPQGSLSSTGYALAKTTGGVQILAYQSASGAFTINLGSITGTFGVEWQRVANSAGTISAGSNISGGATRTLTPPWAGEDVVAFLQKLADEITPAYISSTATVYSPTVTPGAVTLAPDAIGSSAVVYAPTIAAGAVTIAPDAIESTATVYAPTIATGTITLYPDAIASTAVVYEPTLAAGAVTIAPDAIASAATVYAPAITTGAMLYPDAIGSTAIVYEPTVTPGAATIAPDLVVSVAVVYAPTVQPGAVAVAPDAISSAAAVYAPTVEGSAPTIRPDAIASTAQVFVPTVTPGAVTIAPDAIASVSVVFAPFVGTGTAQVIAPDAILSTAVVYAATLAAVAAERVYRVAAEDRTYAVEYENRTYTVQGV